MYSIAPIPRHEILSAVAEPHGAIDYAELEGYGLTPDDILDFSVNNNPFGASDLILDAIKGAPISRYPDRECLALRRAVARKFDRLPDQVLIGNGASELIWLAAFSFLRADDPVMIFGPTFGEFARSAQLVGAEMHMIRQMPGQLIHQNPVARIQEVQPRVVFLCHPNNPTGTAWPVSTIGSWAAHFPDTLFVVDEVHLPFSLNIMSTLTLDAPNIVVLRSMTKEHAMPGLRIGYAIGHEDVIDALARSRPPWNVSGLAQAAGLAALSNDDYVAYSIRRLRDAKQQLVSGLESLGFRPLPSETHFFLLPVERETATDFRRRLLQHGILVRDCTSFGLPRYVRISTRTEVENERLLRILAREKKTLW